MQNGDCLYLLKSRNRGKGRIWKYSKCICLWMVYFTSMGNIRADLQGISQVVQSVNNLQVSGEDTRDVGSFPGLGWSPKEEMATHSCVLSWKIPWTEEPGGLQSMGFQRVQCKLSDWACARMHTHTHTHTHTHHLSIQFLKTLSLFFLSETQTEMSKVYRSRAQKNSFSGSSNISVINIQMEYIKIRLRRTLSVQRIQRICWVFHALKNGM